MILWVIHMMAESRTSYHHVNRMTCLREQPTIAYVLISPQIYWLLQNFLRYIVFDRNIHQLPECTRPKSQIQVKILLAIQAIDCQHVLAFFILQHLFVLPLIFLLYCSLNVSYIQPVMIFTGNPL